VKTMEKIRKSLTSQTEMRIHLSARVDSISKISSSPESPWLQFVNKEEIKAIQKYVI
jgi:hypothetical protein